MQKWERNNTRVRWFALLRFALACEQALRDALAAGREKVGAACNYVSGIWIPPPIPLWLPVDWAVGFPPITAKRKDREFQQTLEITCQGNDVITNVISANKNFAFSHRLFWCRYSNSRDVVASSPSTPSFSLPSARAPRRACSQARFASIYQSYSRRRQIVFM